MALDMSAFSPGSPAARLLAVLDQSRVTRHRFSRGATIFHQGDRATAMKSVFSSAARRTRLPAAAPNVGAAPVS
jgi:CRP-like cAMP-binding protein